MVCKCAYNFYSWKNRIDVFFGLDQNDVSEIPDLTFSMDADEEKHILYEKTEVRKLAGHIYKRE